MKHKYNVQVVPQEADGRMGVGRAYEGWYDTEADAAFGAMRKYGLASANTFVYIRRLADRAHRTTSGCKRVA